MSQLPVTRVVLYKHGVGYFEREGTVDGDAALSLTFKQSEVSDVLKSLTVLDLNGGHINAVSYDSTKPIEQLLSEIALTITDRDSLMSLLPQIKGARVRIQPEGKAKPVEGVILGIDIRETDTPSGRAHQPVLSVLGDEGELLTFDLYRISLQLLDPAMRRDLDFYLRTQLSSKKKDARSFTLFAQGQGTRTVRMSYVLEAPVWKATYRILLHSDDQPPLIQGWAVVDNMQDEDWEDVHLSLIAGLPVSFVHDLYTPRYIRRPVVEVKETSGVLPPEVEAGIAFAASYPMVADEAVVMEDLASRSVVPKAVRRKAAASSMPTQVRERQIGDLFEYEIERPVTILRNQSALVPIVLKSFGGRTVLLYQKSTRPENPMRCVEFENTTGLTLEGGPVTVLEEGAYVGEAMLDTLKPSEQRLVPYAVELAVRVTDRIESHAENVSRVVIHKGTLRAMYAMVQTTTFTLVNHSDRDYVVYLDFPCPDSEWKLVDTPQPHEITESGWRFKFVLPKHQTAQYPVKSQKVLEQAHSLQQLNGELLSLWVQQKYLDATTQGRLSEAVRHRATLADIERQINALQKEREQIHVEQQRIRENLQSLGDRTSEKELRERFVRTLNAQEDRLEQIGPAMAACVQQQNEARTLLEETVMRLQSDVRL